MSIVCTRVVLNCLNKELRAPQLYRLKKELFYLQNTTTGWAGAGLLAVLSGCTPNKINTIRRNQLIYDSIWGAGRIECDEKKKNVHVRGEMGLCFC